MELIKIIKTISNMIYVYKINNDLFVFKPSKNIEREILANKLAKLLDINVLRIKSAKIESKKGILMHYLEGSILLMHYKKKLNKKQIKQLKRIILFDIWLGNKDRHTANIFVNHDLIPFDHEKIFQEGSARKFIKLDIGRKLNKNYANIIENLLDKNLMVTKVLRKLGFTKEDFVNIKNEDIKNIVKNEKLANFLISRKDFSSIKF